MRLSGCGRRGASQQLGAGGIVRRHLFQGGRCGELTQQFGQWGLRRFGKGLQDAEQVGEGFGVRHSATPERCFPRSDPYSALPRCGESMSVVDAVQVRDRQRRAKG